jgi:hypothetical protein
MKHFAIATFLYFLTAACFSQSTFKAVVTDSAWDGKTVPKSQVCKRFGGKEAVSPTIQVDGIPLEANAILISFSDESYTQMSNGGHGVILFDHQMKTSAVIPNIPAETDNLPEGLSQFKSHSGRGWSGSGGAYLPPCSGGRGNYYSVEIAAVIVDIPSKKIVKKLAKASLELGRY